MSSASTSTNVLTFKAPQPLKLNLGAHKNPMPGYVNVDMVPYPGVDQLVDLEKRWPWEDRSVDEIYCRDFPEHLRQWWEEPDERLLAKAKNAIDDCHLNQHANWAVNAITALESLIKAIEKPKRTYGVLHFMGESYRVLKAGGLLECVIPSTDGRGAFQDPTHVSYWNENTLNYFLGGHLHHDLYEETKGIDWGLVSRSTGPPDDENVRWLHFILEKL